MKHTLFAMTVVAMCALAGCSQPEAPKDGPGMSKEPAAAAPEIKDGKPVAGPPAPPEGPKSAPSAGADVGKLGPKAVKTKSGLQYEDLKVGEGAAAADGKTVSVHYTGWLTDGTKFDSSLDRGEPFELTLPGQVIPGWNEGIPGMKAGGKRKLVIPANLAYGDNPPPGAPIGPGATLVFEIEMLAVK